MRRFATFLLLVLGGPMAWAEDQWTYFGDPGGVFTVAVPAKPMEGKDSTPGPDGKQIPMQNWIIERPKGALALLVSDLTSVADTSTMLATAVANLKKGAAKDFTDAPIVLDGHQGHDVHLVDPDGLLIEDRVFLVDKKVYQVMTVQDPKGGPAMAAEATRFMTSFHFTKH